MKIKLLSPSARLPSKQHEGDAGFDLYSPESLVLPPGSRYKIKLGIAVEISADDVILIQGRSGHAVNVGLTTIGNVIDSSYRGEISVIVINLGQTHASIAQGERVAQLLIMRLGDQSLDVVEQLAKTTRDASGIGSSGKF